MLVAAAARTGRVVRMLSLQRAAPLALIVLSIAHLLRAAAAPRFHNSAPTSLLSPSLLAGCAPLPRARSCLPPPRRALPRARSGARSASHVQEGGHHHAAQAAWKRCQAPQARHGARHAHAHGRGRGQCHPGQGGRHHVQNEQPLARVRRGRAKPARVRPGARAPARLRACRAAGETPTPRTVFSDAELGGPAHGSVAAAVAAVRKPCCWHRAALAPRCERCSSYDAQAPALASCAPASSAKQTRTPSPLPAKSHAAVA